MNDMLDGHAFNQASQNFTREAVKSEVGLALDTVTSALLSTEYLSTQRREELARMVQRCRVAIQESL